MDPDPAPTTLIIFLVLLDYDVAISLIAMVVLLFFSAIISGSEVAFFSLTPQDKDRLASEKSRSAQLVLELLKQPRTLLANILIGNNLANVAIVILSSLIVNQYDINEGDRIQMLLIQVGMVTTILLLFGEIVPKVIATKHSYRLALVAAYPMRLMGRVFQPLSNVLVFLTRRFSSQDGEAVSRITADELSHALELTTDGNTTEEEKRILSGIVKFGSTEVRQVMTPRIHVIAVDKSTDFMKLQEFIREHGFSRMPVFNESFDQVEGVLYIKDLLPHLHQSADFNWQQFVRPVLFVTENKKLDDLLREFQYTKNHLAVVVDEYGGSSGVVTLEDIIEQIVGEITDEFDDEELTYSKLDESNFVFEGRTALMDVYRVLEIDGKEFEAVKGDSDSIAGLILEMSGRIPQKNEKIRFGKYEFTIESADRRRIRQVKLTILT